MIRAFIFGILSFVIFTIFSCSEEKKQSTQNTSIEKVEKRISISSIGGIQFTRSYSEIQSMRDEKKIDEYLERQRKSNPYYMKYKSDSIIKLLFQNLGLVKDDELLLSKFRYSSRPDTSIKSFSGKEIRFHLHKDTTGNNHDRVIAFYDGDSSKARPTFHQRMEYAFLEVIPGGNKELVVLTEDYLMNTDIYTFEVFEIKTKGE